MIIYPAIDLLDGRCVRLKQGRYDQVTVYNDDPVAVALDFKAAGAKWLHVVDLDAARTGQPKNRKILTALKKQTGLKIQTGGGIRDLATVERLLEQDLVERVILGTAALRDRQFTRQALKLYGAQIAIGVDARDGLVFVDGWTSKSDVTVFHFIERLIAEGAGLIIYTDISRDGMLTGPATRSTRELVNRFAIDFIASGGIGVPEDIEAIRETGAAGVIVGKAIYEGKVNLKECLSKK